jgi:DNA-binding NtrC family response regulator
MSSAVELQTDRRPARRILLIGDHSVSRASLARRLEARVDRLAEVATSEEALRCLGAERFDLVIASDEPGSGGGIERLESMRLHWPQVARVLISAGDDPATARDAVNRAGVCYWLRPPLSDATLDELFASLAPEAQGSALPKPLAGMLGESPAMRRLFDLVLRVARTDSSVLVLGETGTGKDLIGRAIHDASPRAARPWCAVNSAAFPETLLESELFGHRRGSFTGATSNSAGLFEEAAGGTVFLDEVAEMPLSMQAKLLRFLQTGEIRAVGSASTRIVDVRLVAATNKQLEREIARGAFREDLYYRCARAWRTCRCSLVTSRGESPRAGANRSASSTPPRSIACSAIAGPATCASSRM